MSRTILKPFRAKRTKMVRLLFGDAAEQPGPAGIAHKNIDRPRANGKVALTESHTHNIKALYFS